MPVVLNIRFSDHQVPAVTPEFVRGVTTSIQFEAAECSNQSVDPSVRKNGVALGHISPEYRPSIVIVDSRDYGYWGRSGGYWDWSTTKVTNNYYGPVSSSKSKTKEEKEEDSARMAVVIASIVAVVGAGVAGYAYSLLNSQREALHKMQAIEQALDEGRTENLTPPVLSHFARLVDTQLAIDELKTQKITNYFLSSIVALTAVPLLFSGAFWMAPFLIAAGKLSLVGSAACGALNLGLHFNDDKILSRYYEVILGNPSKGIKGLADHILQTLNQEEIARKKEAEINLAAKKVTPLVVATAPVVQEVYKSLTPGCYVADGVLSPDPLLKKDPSSEESSESAEMQEDLSKSTSPEKPEISLVLSDPETV